MKVFVFGAGASKGSQGERNDTLRAPLVDDLFHPDYIGHARLAGLEDDDMLGFRQAIGEAGGFLEQWLTHKWQALGDLRREVSKQAEKSDFGRLAFYITSLLLAVSTTYNQSNGYSIFAQKLRGLDEEWGLINFNYDTLLDLALHHRFTMDFGRIDDYLAVNYLKPHGSVNWFLPLRHGPDPIFLPYREVRQEGERDVRARIALASYWMFNGPPMRGDNIVVIRPNHVDLKDFNFRHLFVAFDWSYFYPIVFMPLTIKMYSVVEGFEQRVVGRGRELMSNASEIFLIGYRANDAIIREMMGDIDRETTLHVIGRGDAEEISNRVCAWSPHLRRGIVYSDGFLEYVMTVMPPQM